MVVELDVLAIELVAIQNNMSKEMKLRLWCISILLRFCYIFYFVAVNLLNDSCGYVVRSGNISNYEATIKTCENPVWDSHVVTPYTNIIILNIFNNTMHINLNLETVWKKQVLTTYSLSIKHLLCHFYDPKQS